MNTQSNSAQNPEQTTQAPANPVLVSEAGNPATRSPALDAIKKAIGEVVCYGGIMLETNSRVDLQILGEVTEELLDAIASRRVELKAAQTVGSVL